MRLLALFILLTVCAFPGGEGSTTVTTAGTPVQLLVTSPPTQATGCTITALSTNTGTIWIGLNSSVSAANKHGTPLGPPVTAGQPGAAYTCVPNAKIFTLGTYWLDSTVSGEGVSFSWF